MTKENKYLLLCDLSARLPYGVICDCLHNYHTKASAVDSEDLTVYYPYCDEWESIKYCKPYLRPLSSMTEEERKEIGNLIKENRSSPYGIINNKGIDNLLFSVSVTSSFLIDWLNAHHFDYRGLIEKGLAIAVTEENNPYEN